MKRFFDIAFSIAILPLLVVLAAGVATAVRCCIGSPILFRQQRTGKDSQPFELIKFRTMTNACGPDGELLPDEQRTGKLGRFLRSSGLDELPEILHVLRGEMSLVGPRPLLPEYLDEYTPEQARRHRFRPGITGLAQVSGRTALSWEETFQIDNQYIDTWSIWLDLKILFRTAAIVLNGSRSARGTVDRGKFRRLGGHDDSANDGQ